MSRVEKIRNRNIRARKLDTPAAVVPVPARLEANRAAAWKLQWLGAVAARRADRFNHSPV